MMRVIVVRDGRELSPAPAGKRGEVARFLARVRHLVQDEGFAVNPRKGRVERAGGRQSDAVGSRGLKDDVEVLGLVTGFESRLAVAREKALGFDIQRPALAGTAANRFNHFVNVRA